MKQRIFAFVGAAVLSACTMMPHYERPTSPVPDHWPSDAPPTIAQTSGASDQAIVSADQIGWGDFFTDPRLRHLIESALENNRNLRIAVLNVAASEAEFRVQRGNLFPAISATGAGLGERVPAGGVVSSGAIIPARRQDFFSAS